MHRLCSWTLLVLILLYAASQWGCTQNAQSKNVEDEEETVVALPVEVSESRLGRIAAFFTGVATLEAEGEALVVAKTSGVVEKIFVEEGAYVQAGHVLAQLDHDQARLELSQMEADLQRLEGDLKRYEELFEKQLISTEDYEQVKYDYASQKAQHDLAGLKVDHAQVRAPISGVVSERLIKVGNMVGQNEATFRITDFTPLLAVLHVPEKELSKLKPGQTALLAVDAVPGTRFEGRIDRISPVVDAATGTFKVTVEVSDDTRRLKPGMLARVNVNYDVRDDALLIPKEAVVVEDAESAVYIVRDDTAFRTLVRTGYTDATSVEILEGLETGTTVVTIGQNALKDSARVEIVE